MISFICSTRNPSESFKTHVIKMCGLDKKKVEFLFYQNNGEYSLTEIYNKGLVDSKYDVNVFLHDDIIIETKQIGNKIINHFNSNPEYGIIGVAGTRKLTSGRWWDSRKNMMGIINHEKDGKKWESKYSNNIGDNINECVVLDGVFLAVHKKRITKVFNERFDGFHFYDISFCFDNYISGVKIGVITNIRITHKSIGITNDKWLENKVIFEELFNSNLPVIIPKTIRESDKNNIFIGCGVVNDNSINEHKILNTIRDKSNNLTNITICGKFSDNLKNKIRSYNVKLYDITEPPFFKLGDGVFNVNNNGKTEPSIKNVLYKIGDNTFDQMYLFEECESKDYFSKLYNDVDIIKTIEPLNIKQKDVDIYIFIHDQELLIKTELSGKFKKLGSYKYVFLGNRNTDKLCRYSNVIYANSLGVNLEENPKFAAFTGWFALYKNNLLNNGNDLLLLEYDVTINNNFMDTIKSLDGNMIGFVPFDVNNYHFINNGDWVNSVSLAIKDVYNIDIINYTKKCISKANGLKYWLSTNNILFDYNTFVEYMEWFEPLIDKVKCDINCGHGQERCLTFFSLLKSKNVSFISDILKHYQLDSHKTQGHIVSDDAIERLLGCVK